MPDRVGQSSMSAQPSRSRLTPKQAERAWQIIWRMAGADDDLRDEFINYVTTPIQAGNHEFRFMGSLGFGGKFYFSRTQGARLGCYREDCDDIAAAIIDAANELLKGLDHA